MFGMAVSCQVLACRPSRRRGHRDRLIRSSKAEEMAAALQSLERTAAEAARMGLLGHQFEARLALGEIEMRSGKSAAGKARLRAPAAEAKDKWFGLIARKAQDDAPTPRSSGLPFLVPDGPAGASAQRGIGDAAPRWKGAGRGWRPECRRRTACDGRAVRPHHGPVVGDRVACDAARGSHGDAPAQWQGARGRRHRHLSHPTDVRRDLRPGHGHLDGRHAAVDRP